MIAPFMTLPFAIDDAFQVLLDGSFTCRCDQGFEGANCATVIVVLASSGSSSDSNATIAYAVVIAAVVSVLVSRNFTWISAAVPVSVFFFCS